MTKNKAILYIGNDFSERSGYTTTMETLSDLLTKESFVIFKSSNKSNKFLRLIDMCYSVLNYRNRIDYIIIDTFSTSSFYFALIVSQLARCLKLKYIPILHGGNLPSRLDSSRYFSSLLFSNSYHNIAPSRYLAHEFQKRNYNTTLIPNVILIDNYNYKERIKIMPTLLYVRAFDKIYNPLMAIDVLLELKKSYPQTKLCMVGPDRDGTLVKVKKAVKKFSLEESVEFTGLLKQKEWHKKSENFDIFLNTTNVDNTPVSVIEAMALGIPVVSTNVGGIPFLLEDGVDALLVEKGNVKQMSNALKKLIKGEYLDISKKARLKVESFAWSSVRSKWLSILK